MIPLVIVHKKGRPSNHLISFEEFENAGLNGSQKCNSNVHAKMYS